MINGLRITIAEAELQGLLNGSVAQHREASSHWKRERRQSTDESTEEPTFSPIRCARSMPDKPSGARM
jgi:hypothetical protein